MNGIVRLIVFVSMLIAVVNGGVFSSNAQGQQGRGRNQDWNRGNCEDGTPCCNTGNCEQLLEPCCNCDKSCRKIVESKSIIAEGATAGGNPAVIIYRMAKKMTGTG